MIKHIVLWKLKDFAEGADKGTNAQRMKSILEELKDRITVIRSIEVGLNLTQSPDVSDIALYCEFDNVRDLQTYQNHPEHLKAVDFIRKVRTERCVVDYEVG